MVRFLSTTQNSWLVSSQIWTRLARSDAKMADDFGNFSRTDPGTSVDAGEIAATRGRDLPAAMPFRDVGRGLLICGFDTLICTRKDCRVDTTARRHTRNRPAGQKVRILTIKVSITLNGRCVRGRGNTYAAVEMIRDYLGATGIARCDTSQCGACVVHANGASIKSCTMLRCRPRQMC
jgi:hypothetical protein